MLIKDIVQLKAAYGGIQQTMNFTTWSPFINEAELFFIIPAIGEELYAQLDILITNNTSLNAKQTRLVSFLRIALAGYADFLGWFRMTSSTGDAGKVVLTPPNTQPTGKWYSAAGRKDAVNRADKALESALVYLEQNKDDFTTWKNSSACTLKDKEFISSASELTKYFPQVNKSRRVFLLLRDYLILAQNYLVQVIGKAQYNAWILKISNPAYTPTPKEEDAWLLVRALIARKAFSEAIPYLNISEDWRLISETDGIQNEEILPQSRRDELANKEEQNAVKYRNELIRFLQENASSSVFAEYFASGLYETRLEKTTFSKFQNSKDNKFFVL